uniref:Uncharacterized protein n=1 Tax=Physcomitrium patens TaxID=3218 RepID=A0A2K1JKA9_PHYPA|nr:hypothetical protein PHYPA_016806 [Physcomitrium patens]
MECIQYQYGLNMVSFEFSVAPSSVCGVAEGHVSLRWSFCSSWLLVPTAVVPLWVFLCFILTCEPLAGASTPIRRHGLALGGMCGGWSKATAELTH